MASAAPDSSGLSESQQLALATVASVTNQEPSDAIPLLRRSEWNVQIAIAKFFDGEAPNPVEEARAALVSPPPSTQPAHRETLLNGLSSFPREAGVPRGQPAPRIVPQPHNQTSHQPSPILSMLFTPFNVLYVIFSKSLRIFGYLFPFLPRMLSAFFAGNSPASSRLNTTGRRPLNPRDTAARFAREFEEEYGSHSLHFFENGYAQAYDLAKKDLMFLLVVLISPEHDDNSTFIRETLLSETVTNYIHDPQNKIILWAGNVQDSEAYQISSALNCSKFPFTALIAHTPQDSTQDSTATMSTIARITGLLSPSAYVSRLRSAIAQQSAALDRLRATRAEQQAAQNLRNEQNSAYERSLAQDRERARLRREAEASELLALQGAAEKRESEKKQRQRLEEWRLWRAQLMLPEPRPEDRAVARISIRMTSGERVVRRFAQSATIEELYAFIECYEILKSGRPSQPAPKPQDYRHDYTFRLVSPIPRVIYDCEDSASIGDKLGSSGNLIVESISEDEDDEDDGE
ncbi:hypothetical protein MMC07_004313 [Pseudocyphellaria aurata]|nr:hypothetical protein [Pseudocyphellaria aurata]